MKQILRVVTTLICLTLLIGVQAQAQTEEVGGIGIRAGVGTDINLGLAYGAEINYAKYLGRDAFEIALAVYAGHYEEESEEGGNIYEETTDIMVIGALVNYLFLYSMDEPGPYFVAGFGFGAVSMEWEEKSATDSSLGTPLPGVPGGSMQDADGSAGGTIINFGIGYRINKQVDIRAQLPTFLVFSTPGDASSVIPTFTITLGYRF
jgi:hypothetical protein